MRIYLAKQYAKLYSPEIFVGITGSVGKTVTAQLCHLILSQKYNTLVTRSNPDRLINIPLTLLKLNPSIKKVILEMGVKQPGEMEHYLSLVKPKVAIYTNISAMHSDDLDNINDVLQQLGKLIESLGKDGTAIINWDDVNSRKLASLCQGSVLYYGTDKQNCTLWAGNIRVENLKTIFELNQGVERVKVEYQPLGSDQIYSVLAAATLGVICGIPLTKIKIALESVIPAEHHLQPVSGPNGSLILDDTHDSSPSAVNSAIDTLLQIPSRRRIIVLGEMKRLGNYAERLYRQLGQRIYKDKLDLVLLGPGETNFLADELKSLGFWEERIYTNLQNSQMVSRLLKTLSKGDVCLITGAQTLRLDEVVKRIAKK